jgi:inorganic pyrophosphatase
VTDFFAACDDLLAGSSVVVDRPAGTAHPQHPEVIYPVDYGYLQGTTAGDGDEIDVFVGSELGAGVVGVAFTIDPNKRDAEVKVLTDCSETEIETIRRLLDGHLGLGVQVLRR